MNPLPPDNGFIGGLLKYPGMYVIGDKFAGVVNLMFGMKICNESAAEGRCWDEFQDWLCEKYAERILGPIFSEFRSWFETDADALQVLVSDYDEFLSERDTPELMLVSHFEALLRRPNMYAKNWDEFGGMVRGALAFAQYEVRRQDALQDWENFQH